MAVPGTVLGIGYLLAYRPDRYIGDLLGRSPGWSVAPPSPAAPWPSCSPTSTRSVPAGLRTGGAALTQLHPSIEEASVNLGAGSFRTFRAVVLPLIRPAAAHRAELQLRPQHDVDLDDRPAGDAPDTKIITSQILSAANTGRYGVAFAYCTVLTAIVLRRLRAHPAARRRRRTLYRTAAPAGRKHR